MLIGSRSELLVKVIPALARIEENQQKFEAAQMSILKGLRDLEAEPISTPHSIPPWMPPSQVGMSSSAPTRSSTLISFFERAAISIQYFAVRGNASRYGVLARVKIGTSLALVAEVSGRYLISSIPIPTLAISFRGIIPEDSPIILACCKGHTAEVSRLLDRGVAKPNDCTPTNRSLLSVFQSPRCH